MQKIMCFDKTGNQLSEITLQKEYFGLEINESLLHQVVTSQLSNARYSIAHTKNKGEVSGGGKKPWKQKGTGRARTGSIRNPLWIGGGITFGPRSNRNWHKSIPKKIRQLALKNALSAKFIDKKIVILDDLTFKSPKTKIAQEIINKLPIDKGTILIVLSKTDLPTQLSFKNIPYVKTSLANNLSVLDVLKHTWLVLTKDALKSFGSKINEIETNDVVKETKKLLESKKVNKKIYKLTKKKKI